MSDILAALLFLLVPLRHSKADRRINPVNNFKVQVKKIIILEKLNISLQLLFSTEIRL